MPSTSLTSNVGSLQAPNNTSSTAHSVIIDIKNWISDSATFAWRFIWAPRILGTPFALSPFVAKELLKQIDAPENSAGRAYLEVGPGTGAMTTHLVNKLRPIDTLDLVEIDKSLYNVLKDKFKDMPNVKVHHHAIQDWQPRLKRKYDVIVTTVPLNSLPTVGVLQDIFAAFRRLIKPKGIISFAEYVGTSTVSETIFLGEKRKAIHEIVAEKKAFFKTHSFDQSIVLANIPPARVIHCKIQTTPQT